MQQNKNVLVCGAGFAGLATAYWMSQMGYYVTVIEIGSHLKMGGTPVDIKDPTVDIVKNMGLYEKIKAHRIGPEKWEFKNAADISEHTVFLEKSDHEFEIERDQLLTMLFDLVKNEVRFIFNNTITALTEKEGGMQVTFKDGTDHHFDLVFGCDGIHSTVRKIWFGEEIQYAHYLGQYFCVAIANKLLVENGTYQLYAEPNKGLTLYAYNNKTDIIFTFRPEQEIVYDFRNREEMRSIVLKHLQGMGWRASELEEELVYSKSFYFDAFCQIRMPSWTKGRVALVGDAGYCASPAAGMGGSLAIIGATVLAKAFEEQAFNVENAFVQYNTDLRAVVEKIQNDAIQALDQLLPATQEEIDHRNKNGFEL